MPISDTFDSKNIVSNLALLYDFDSNHTNIVMNSNFAIIYEVKGENIKIGDLFFNTKIENEYQSMDIENAVIMQIGLALTQIGDKKNIDISKLNEEQKIIYNKAINLKEELNYGGVNYAK